MLLKTYCKKKYNIYSFFLVLSLFISTFLATALFLFSEFKKNSGDMITSCMYADDNAIVAKLICKSMDLSNPYIKILFIIALIIMVLVVAFLSSRGNMFIYKPVILIKVEQLNDFENLTFENIDDGTIYTCYAKEKNILKTGGKYLAKVLRLDKKISSIMNFNDKLINQTDSSITLNSIIYLAIIILGSCVFTNAGLYILYGDEAKGGLICRIVEFVIMMGVCYYILHNVLDFDDSSDKGIKDKYYMKLLARVNSTPPLNKLENVELLRVKKFLISNSLSLLIWFGFMTFVWLNINNRNIGLFFIAFIWPLIVVIINIFQVLEVGTKVKKFTMDIDITGLDLFKIKKYCANRTDESYYVLDVDNDLVYKVQRTPTLLDKFVVSDYSHNVIVEIKKDFIYDNYTIRIINDNPFMIYYDFKNSKYHVVGDDVTIKHQKSIYSIYIDNQLAAEIYEGATISSKMKKENIKILSIAMTIVISDFNLKMRETNIR